jgi:hypothetical protein
LANTKPAFYHTINSEGEFDADSERKGDEDMTGPLKEWKNNGMDEICLWEEG